MKGMPYLCCSKVNISFVNIMAKILKPYDIAVVHGDLSFPQTLGDIFFALDGLTKTIDDSFDRIEKRIVDERKRVDQINERLNTCHTKVSAIVGSTKATTVFSTAKFPGPKQLPVFVSLFNQISQISDPYREADDDVIYDLPASNKSSIGNSEMTKEILTIYCRLNSYDTDMKKVEFIMEDKGLGSIPPQCPTVGSLLLYNSSVNPYKNYQQLDNLASGGRKKAADDADSKNNLASAPKTLIDGDALPDVDAMDLNFRPDTGDINAFALPDNLPLNFIADISYQGMALPSIAPSAQYNNKGSSNLQLTDGGLTMEGGAPLPPPPPAADVPTPTTAAAPPPPPPPPPPGPQPTVEATPPPPPAAQAEPATPPPPPVQETALVVADEGGGGGASFLDAIKGGMGINKLRKAEESSLAAAKIQKKEDTKKPMSVGEELRMKLMRRNK